MFNPQLIAQLQQMAQRGVALKDILYSLKTQGFNPQTAEQILCTAFPQLKQIKRQIDNSGMTSQQYFMQLAKQNHMPVEQMQSTWDDFNKLFR